MAAGHRAAALLAVAAALLFAGAALADGGGRQGRRPGGHRDEGPSLRVPLVIRVFCKEVHGVEAGETCESVALGAGLSVPQFMELNQNLTCTALFPGQWLCVGGAAIG